MTNIASPPQTFPTPFARIRLPVALSKVPPAAYAHIWRHAGQTFPRDLAALTLLATSGWSTQRSLHLWLQHNPQTPQPLPDRTLARMWRRLQRGGLIAWQKVHLSHRPPLHTTLLWLTDEGRHFLYEMGIPLPVISEWDRLRIVHHGPKQIMHTAMVALCAHFLRWRGYETEICPLPMAAYQPDLAIRRSGQAPWRYVEVEAPHRGGRFHAGRLQRKWRLLATCQEMALICALNPAQRQQRVASARQVLVQGLATDLLTLHSNPEITWATAWSKGPSGQNPYGQLSVGGLKREPGRVDF